MIRRVMRTLLSLLILTTVTLGQARATPFVELDPNNGFGEAQLLDPHDGSIDLTGVYNGPNAGGFIDDDFFRFRVASGDLITANLFPNPSTIRMSMFLYDPAELFTGVAVFGSQPSFAYRAPVGGIYYLTTAGLTPFTSGTYRLQVTGLTPSGAVPVPSTLLLLAAALTGWGVWARRSRGDPKYPEERS